MTHAEQAALLLDEQKKDLRVDWDDDENIKNKMVRSMARLDDYIGLPVDYVADGSARELLFNRVRYDYNSAIEYWLDNFREELRSVQYTYAIKNMGGIAP